MNMTFVRIGSMNGQKQKHRNEKTAPAKRGIWMLPQKLGCDLIYLGYGNWIPSSKLEDSKYMKGKIHKIILPRSANIWHHINGDWEKCSVNEYFKILYKHLGNLRWKMSNNLKNNNYPCCHYLDGESYEVFMEC